MKSASLVIFTFICLLLVSSELKAQTSTSDSILTSNVSLKNPEGKEFWLCFMKNFKDEEKRSKANDLLLELFITGDKDANVKIEIGSINYSKTIFVPGGTVKSLKIDPLAQVRSFEIIETQQAIHITSDNPISVYGLNRRFQTTDTYLGLPLEVLGTEYRIMSYAITDDLLSQFAVIATEDNTIIEIAPTVETYAGKRPNETYKVTLNRGDVYQVAGAKKPASKLKCDLTGSYIKSNKKIAVFAGHQCAYVPNVTPEIIACNHLAEQIPPIPSWGKHFYIGKMKLRSKFTYRVLAHYPNTKVFENSNLLQVLNPGEFVEKLSDKDAQITADKPVLVAQYSQGFKNGDSIGDPMMLLISPTQQFLRKYRFATPVNGEWEHIINIVVPTNSINTMQLDGKPIDTLQFKPLGISRYSIAYLSVPFGTHVLEGAMPFGMYSYGFGSGFDAFDAYGTMGGQSFMDYEPVRDVNPPTAEASGDREQFTIILRDDGRDDTGIKDINVLNNQNIDFKNPAFIEAIPQYALKIETISPTMDGKMTFQVRDMALNTSIYSICYFYDKYEGKYRYELYSGEGANCSAEYGYEIGLFGKTSFNFHYADFTSSGNINALGKFSDAYGSSGYLGLLVSRALNDKWSLTAKLSLENYGVTLNATDSLKSRVRNELTGELEDFLEQRNLTLDGLFSQLSLSADYQLSSFFYVSAGLAISMNFSDKVIFEKEIIMPNDFTYANGKRKIAPDDFPQTLSSINSLRYGATLGAGFVYPVYKRFSAFIEANYLYSLNDIAKDTDWRINSFSLLWGLRYKI